MANGSTVQSLVLNGALGWPNGRTALALTGDAALRLVPLPGRAEIIPLDPDDSQLLCPTAIAGDRCHGLLIIDAAADRVFRLCRLAKGQAADCCPTPQQGAGSFEYWIDPLNAIGGTGSMPRAFHHPRGIALLPSSTVAVSDTVNHRVQIFSGGPAYALIHVFGASDPYGVPTPGDGPTQFRWPWGVAADRAGVLHIVDRGNHRVQRIASDGTWLPAIGSLALVDPTSIALSYDGTIAVVDRRSDESTIVVVFQTGRVLPRTLEEVQNARSVAFNARGDLLVGDAVGCIHVFVRDEGFRRIGCGATGIDGAVAALVWDGAHEPPESVSSAAVPRLLAIIRSEIEGRAVLCKVDPSGGSAGSGELVTSALDSRIDRCQWNRVVLDASVPDGTSLQVDSYTAPTDNTAPTVDEWTRCVMVADAPRATSHDCLVQSEAGRFLWLRLTFRSNGAVSPELRGVSLSFPRVSYLQYLPAVFQEDEDSRRFLDRFLSIFQSGFDDFDRTIDGLANLFDPRTVPAEHLHWLAAWVALPIDTSWSETMLRTMLEEAVAQYATRGTVSGLEKLVSQYAGVQFVKVLEHFRLRRWTMLQADTLLDGTSPLWSRDFYRRLQVTSYSQLGSFRLTGLPEPPVEPLDWGSHRFTVFYPATPMNVEDVSVRVARIVEREKPAHAEALYCPVLPRFRVGLQSTIGVDAVVGDINPVVLNRLATLSYDTVLGCSPLERQMRESGGALRPRAGVTTKLP